MLKKGFVLYIFSQSGEQIMCRLTSAAIAFLAVFVLVDTAQAICSKKTSLKDLTLASKAGEKAFSDMELDVLLTHSSRMRDDLLPCLGEKITPQVAAAFHRMMALQAFAMRKKDRAVSEFHAARKLSPGYEIPLDVAHKNHPLRKLYEKALMAQDGKLEVVYPPKGGYITVGGVKNAPRPNLTPVIIQVFLANEVLKETRYLQPGETLPVWGVDPNSIGKNIILQPSVFSKPKTWYYTAAVLGLVAGGFYIAAMGQKGKFQDTSQKDTPASDKKLEDYQDNANTLGTVSIVSGGFALASAGVGAGYQIFFGDNKVSGSNGRK
jgi:hypothetical protein